jgi:DNA-binding transcriptional regulator YdaS (Cro superfamily)
MQTNKKDHLGLTKAIEAAGGVRALARALKCDHTSILQWTKVPYRRLLDVERVTGVRREVLRPEIHR